MKYETFKKLRIGGIVALIGGGIFGISQCSSKKSANNVSSTYENRTAQTSPSSRPPQQNTQAPVARPDYGSGTLPLSARDQRILEMQKGPTSSGKTDENGLKQSVTTSDFKLDLRSDTKKGYMYWNRVKVDYNMNHKWDEKWSFGKDGKIRREVAPADDENYSMEYLLQGNKWVKQ